MPYDPETHHRRSIRLKGYDYTHAGAYFITIVTQGRECLFGEIVDGEMRVNEYGQIVRDEWMKTRILRPQVILDEFVVMPNHIHGIICVEDDTVGAQHRCAPTMSTIPPRGVTPNNVVPGSLGAIIRAFKSAVTKQINDRRGTPGATVWQRNYYEHIIRNDHSLQRIREYILTNPLRWHLDVENPNATGVDILWDSLFSPTQNTNAPTP
jgi:REP element-mobilizing transposase RayT